MIAEDAKNARRYMEDDQRNAAVGKRLVFKVQKENQIPKLIAPNIEEAAVQRAEH